ncbi:MAG: proteinase inhibitor serpin [Chlamydiia bacterium]|nr:proteinase inhibitor serpin [Chlamydiia bacterium]
MLYKMLFATIFFWLSVSLHAQDEFSFRLTETLLTQKENVVFSPYSIRLALDMAYIGARGKTREEMAALFSNQIFLSASLPKSGGGFDSFQAIAIDRSYTPLQSYIDTLETKLQAEVFSVDFTKNFKDSLAAINGWVSLQSKGHISTLLQAQDASSATKMVLLNAAYFKNSWKIPFEVASTSPSSFTSAEGEVSSVDMMHQEGTFSFFQDEIVQGIELEYAKEGDGPEYSCVVILPKQKNGLEEIVKNFSSLQFEKWLSIATKKYISLFLPKTTITFQCDLRASLESLGMKSAFSREADFSGMSVTGKDLMISKVLHQAVLSLNEAGTEASAATAVIMNLKSMPPIQDKITMNCDHPFLVIIREKKEGGIFFIAKVVKSKV